MSSSLSDHSRLAKKKLVGKKSIDPRFPVARGVASPTRHIFTPHARTRARARSFSSVPSHAAVSLFSSLGAQWTEGGRLLQRKPNFLPPSLPPFRSAPSFALQFLAAWSNAILSLLLFGPALRPMPAAPKFHHTAVPKSDYRAQALPLKHVFHGLNC